MLDMQLLLNEIAAELNSHTDGTVSNFVFEAFSRH